MGYRWYDCDPTLSMAVSLLQSVSDDQREPLLDEGLDYITATYPSLAKQADDEGNVVFFWKRRQGWNSKMWRMLTLVEALPHHDRQDVALWLLDALLNADGQHDINALRN
jgi:hypothetical protein